jgi:7,8-dihydropterin-6-yl-methyl-4-(beta-D-ribofuranosyl)aminobenzene 5'-phosphate synthase
MKERIMKDDFGMTQDVSITVLVDNRADLIVKSTDEVKYYTEKPLLAEHGFSALVELKSENMHILWDAGVTSIALPENMRRMGIDPASIDKIALSHGHHDHYAALTQLLNAIDLEPESKEWSEETPLEEFRLWAKGRRIPLIAHPAAFRERWGIKKDGKKVGPFNPPPKEAWAAAGAEIVLSEGPYQLGPGCWTTGAVPRKSFESSGISSNMRYRVEGDFLPDKIEEDQAIVIHAKDKGLIVLSGCAHSGIVNTVNHAREISAVDKIWAILGGFHLARASDEELRLTIEAIKEFRPHLIAPSHCTGFKAICEFAREMPEAFVVGQVGTTYLF